MDPDTKPLFVDVDFSEIERRLIWHMRSLEKEFVCTACASPRRVDDPGLEPPLCAACAPPCPRCPDGALQPVTDEAYSAVRLDGPQALVDLPSTDTHCGGCANRAAERRYERMARAAQREIRKEQARMLRRFHKRPRR